MKNYEILQTELKDLLLGTDNEAPINWTRKVIKDGLDPLDFFTEIFSPAMTAIGILFQRLEIFLPELIDASEKGKEINNQVIRPLLASMNANKTFTRGKVLICSVQNDLHNIGKNMVALMLEVNGFDVIDLGVDVDSRTIIDRAKKENADIVALSSLLTTTVPYMKEVIDLRNGMYLQDDFAIIVGGAAISKEFANKIGADAFGIDAIDGLSQCIALMK